MTTVIITILATYVAIDIAASAYVVYRRGFRATINDVRNLIRR